ncbi:MAG: hypothetical protein EZS28_035183, partial [Streblomastix strix]
DQIDAYTKTQDDALLLLKADKTQLIDAYSKTEADALLDDKLNVSDQIDAYTKTQDDALLLLKADKTQLIVAYTKGEDDALLLLKADKTQLIDAYTKGEDDALQLLKADKTQLIDAYTKGETNNLLNNKADSEVSYTKGEADNLLNYKANSGVSHTKGEDDALLLLKADKTQLIDAYTKGEDDALLLLKANQTTTYTKTETDYLISQIEVGDVDLSGYMTLDTSQTITANKTFNNACRFVSSIDEMATITGTSFVKSGADDTVVLLGAGGTKPLSEFASGSVDDSNYVKKTGQELQIIHGVLRRNDDELSMSEYNEEYLTKGEICNAFVSRYDNQTIYGTKTFNSKVNAAGFAKTGKDYTSVLLAGGGDRLLSDFSSGGASVEDLTSQVAINVTATGFNYSSLAFVKIGNLYLFQMQVTPKQEGFAQSMIIKIGTLPSQYAQTVSELYMPVGGPYGAFKPHICSDGDNLYTVYYASQLAPNYASVPSNAIIQSPCFGLASCGQLLNKYLFGNTPVVAYDAVNVILSPQTINYGSEPLEAKKLFRSNYELKSNFVIAFGTEFGPQLEQVAVIHQQVQDNVL